MKTAKKVLALLLSVLMVFTMVSSSVVAVAETTPTEKTEIENVGNKVTNAFDTVKGIIDGVHNLVGGILSMLGKECVFCDEVHTKAETDDEDTQEPTEPETPPSEPEVPAEPEQPTEPEEPTEPEKPETGEPAEDKVGNIFDSIGGIFNSVHGLVGGILAIFGKECPFCDEVHSKDAGETDEPEVPEDPSEPEEPDVPNTPDEPDVPEETTYTVSFNLNYEGAENTIPSQTVKAGETAVMPSEPTRDGYTFVGWFVEENKYDFSLNVTSNIILYARWLEATEDTEILVNNIECTPSVIPCGEKAQVFVKTEIKTKIDVTNISFKAFNEDTNNIVELYDNGLNDDDIAGDMIYSGSFYVESNSPKVYDYILIADGYNASFGVYGFSIEFYNKDDMVFVSDVVEEMNYELSNIESSFVLTENDDINVENASIVVENIKKYFDTAKAEGKIIDYKQEGTTFEIKLPIGTYVYMFDVQGLQGTTSNVNTSTNVSVLKSSNKGNEFSIMTAQPYASELNSSCFDNAANSIQNADLGYSFTRNADNATVSVSFMKNLSNYKVIIWDGHGGYTSGLHSFLGLGEQITEEKNTNDYASDIAENRIIFLGGGSYGVTAEFFEHYYADNPFNDSLIYIGACHGADDNVLMQTLLNCGAEAVLAYQNSVYTDYNRDMFETIFDELILFDGDTGLTKTVANALNTAKNTNGEEDPTYTSWYDVLLGRYNKKENRARLVLRENDNISFRLLDYSKDNLSFEENFKYWNERTGDCRVLEQVGELKSVHGDRFAFLSTGVGAINDSISKISRTFKKENGKNTLTFQYNFVSEEPMEYVGSSYDDYFRVYLVDSSTCTEVLKETVNKAEWIYLGGNYFNGGDETTYHTGWKTFSIDLSDIPAGSEYKIIFEVGDIGDSEYDSAALIDNIVIS